jgi:hypothetical protein
MSRFADELDALLTAVRDESPNAVRDRRDDFINAFDSFRVRSRHRYGEPWPAYINREDPPGNTAQQFYEAGRTDMRAWLISELPYGVACECHQSCMPPWPAWLAALKEKVNE